MKCELTAEVPVERFAVFAEMARLERRPELGALCRAAGELSGVIDARAVERVLPGVGAAGCRNIVAWCREVRLCDDKGALTRLGVEAAESDEAPVPEQGVFDLWVAEHPLLGARILHVERLKVTREARFDEIVPLPIAPERERPFRSVVEPLATWVLRDLPAKSGSAGCVRQAAPSSCMIRWTLDFASGKESFRLDGVLEVREGSRRPFQHVPEPAGVDLARVRDDWASAYLSRHGRWAAEGRLEVPFDGLPEAAQESFRHRLRFASVEVRGRGKYADVELSDIPVGPRSGAEAERWALARLDRQLRRDRKFRTRSDLRSLFAKGVHGTPLAPHRPSLPSHAALLGARCHEPALFFDLAAPVDLSPIEVDRGELESWVLSDGGTGSPKAPPPSSGGAR